VKTVETIISWAGVAAFIQVGRGIYHWKQWNGYGYAQDEKGGRRDR